MYTMAYTQRTYILVYGIMQCFVMIDVGGKQLITYFEVSLSFYMLHIGNTSRGSKSCRLVGDCSPTTRHLAGKICQVFQLCKHNTVHN